MSRQSTVQYAIVPSSPPPPTQPTPGLTSKVLNPSATVSAATQLPDATQRDRWGWIQRYPVPITFSIVVFFVLMIITIMLLTLNSDVQQLYDQLPSDATGVRFSVFRFFPTFKFQRSLNRRSGGFNRSRSWDITISWTWKKERSRFNGRPLDVERTSCRRISGPHISGVLRGVDRPIGRSMCI